MTVVRRNKRAKPDPELLKLADGQLANYQKPEDLIGENGLLKQLTKMLVAGGRAVTGGEGEAVDPNKQYPKRRGELAAYCRTQPGTSALSPSSSCIDEEL